MHLFQCDYTGGCLPELLEAINKTNDLSLPGYGEDSLSDEAKQLILRNSGLDEKEAAVFWLSSGTLANLSVLDAVLKSNESVLAADSAHIFTAEAGAIEACGHKIETFKNIDGKITAEQIKTHCLKFERLPEVDRSHLTRQAAVYITFPTEKGSLYSLEELESISEVCKKQGLFLYLDGARLAYGLAASEVKLTDIARLTDAFYIGGTKCGALIGEAVVIKDKLLRSRFLGVLRMRGGLVAKGRVIATAFKAFFENGLYFKVGTSAVNKAQLIQASFLRKGIPMAYLSETNLIFPIVSKSILKQMEQNFGFKVVSEAGEDRYVLRFCTSWSTSEADLNALLEFIKTIQN